MYDAEAELYCAAFAWPVDGEVEWCLAQVARRLGREPAHVLEPMCGNARYGPAFADRGLGYTGFDGSLAMLARAPEDPRLRLAQADAVDFELGTGAFDLAWCPINSLRHLPSTTALERHFAQVRRALVEDGVYVVQTALLDHDGPWPQAPDAQAAWTVAGPDGAEVEARWWYERCDRARRTVREGFRFERRRAGRAPEVVEGHHTMLALSLDDWRRCARRAALELVEVHLPGDPPTPVALDQVAHDGGDNPYLFLRRRA